MMAATDRLLKRPAVPLRRMSDIRFLLIILEVCLYPSLWPITTNPTCSEPIIGSTQLSCRDQVSSQLAQASIWYAQLSEQWMSSRTCQLVLKVRLILFVWEKKRLLAHICLLGIPLKDWETRCIWSMLSSLIVSHVLNEVSWDYRQPMNQNGEYVVELVPWRFFVSVSFVFGSMLFMQTLTTGCVTLSSCCQLFKSEAPNLGFLQCNGRLYQSNGWFWIMAIRIRVSVWLQLLYAMILTSDPHVENSHFANTLFWSVWEPRCKSLNQMLSDKWRPNGEKLSSTCCFIKKHPCHI